MPGLNIGNHIRKLRLEQRRTQQEIADTCGFTKSLLSKIESNKVVPPVATLVKIATALHTKVSVLIEGHKKVSVVANNAREVSDNITKTERGYWIFPLATQYAGKRMQPFFFVARKGEVKEHHLVHEGEEFMYVLQGAMRVQVGTSEWTLRAGDSIYFSSTLEHQVIPVTKTVKYVNLFA
jgi:transcriptional regulator with XRE-family HTH domain